MNSRCLLIIALCGLLAVPRQVWSANLGPQLLPLPAMAQNAAEANIPLKQAPGEVQFIQPSITLTADKEVAEGIDPDAPPMKSNLAVAVDIVKKTPGKDPRPLVETAVPIVDKNGNKVGEQLVPTLLAANATSATFIPVREGGSGAGQIKAKYTLLPTIISAIIICVL